MTGQLVIAAKRAAQDRNDEGSVLVNVVREDKMQSDSIAGFGI